MNPTPFIWKNGTFIPWEQATTHVLTHTLHYAGGAFEGIRCYKTPQGPAIFRLNEHVERLFYSAGVLKLAVPFSPQDIRDAILETARKNNLEEGYIRPLIYCGYGTLKVRIEPETPIDIVIACWTWDKYLTPDAVKVKISSYRRIHPNSTRADAKLCGNYLNSLLAGAELKGTDFDEALFLDHEGHVAEGASENIFMVKKGRLLTPKAGTILPGITRETILEFAKDSGYQCREAIITPDDISTIDEAFFVGTAAEITPIASIDEHVFGNGTPGPITQKLQTAYAKLVRGENKSYEHHLTHL